MIHNPQRFIVLVLVVLLMILPPCCDVASAQSAPRLKAVTFDEIVDTGDVAVAQVNVTQSTTDGRAIIQATVGYGNRSTDIEIHDNEITFEGGYSIRTIDAGSSATLDLIEITATTPDGRTETATLSHNKQNGKAISVGVESVNALLAESEVVDLLSSALPMVVTVAGDSIAQLRAEASTLDEAARTSRNGWLNCAGAILVLAGAVIAVIAACSIPEPGHPLVCGGAIIVAIGTFMQAVDACNFPDRCKQPC